MKTYHELPNHVQAYLHATEVHACIHALHKLFRPEDAKRVLQEQLNHRNAPNMWEDAISSFYSTRAKKPLDQLELVFYYLTAGCGITKITKLLNVGQSTVYKVKNNEDYSRRHTTLEGMFLTDSYTTDGLRRMTDALQVLDGFRVVPQGMTSSLGYSTNHENFAKAGEFKLMGADELERFQNS